VFTTRIDTIYGATFVLLAPEHPLVERFADESRTGRVPARVARSARRIARRAMTGEVEKEGFDTGRASINPFTSNPCRLGRELRARRVRHGRGDGRAGARRARLRVRAQIPAADPVVVQPTMRTLDGDAGDARTTARARWSTRSVHGMRATRGRTAA
jgi:leucyl-tRNA synthetase